MALSAQLKDLNLMTLSTNGLRAAADRLIAADARAAPMPACACVRFIAHADSEAINTPIAATRAT